MINKELKKCPFCGKPASTAINFYSLNGINLMEVTFSVRCTSCNISKGITKEVEGEAFSTWIGYMNNAIERWNQRANEKE